MGQIAPSTAHQAGTSQILTRSETVRPLHQPAAVSPDLSWILREAMQDACKGWPLIFFAVHGSRIDLVDYLLECGTSPDILSPDGMPLLAFAILCKKNERAEGMVKVLLKYGADVSVIPLDLSSDFRVPALRWMGGSRQHVVGAFEKRLTQTVR